MDWNKKNVMVTGGLGFIGSHLVRKFVDLGANVSCVSKEKPTKKSRLNDILYSKTKENLKHISLDLKNMKEFDNSEIDYVFHLAATVNTSRSFDNPEETYENNILSTLNVLEFCRKVDVKKILFAGTYVYGKPEYLPIDEKHPLNPNNPYTRSKLIGEQLCRSYFEDYGIKCIILRGFNIYGESQSFDFLIPSIIKQLISDGKIVLNDPRPKRDFVYVGDVVDAYIKAAESKIDYDMFNIGLGISYSVDKISKLVIKLYTEEFEKKKSKIEYLNRLRRNEVLDVFADISKAKRKLEWEPKMDIKEGIRKTLIYYKKLF